jgi:ABC-type transporter Mla maintaining outer membrane lipid asymmetry ATPase subunit MlaF
MEHVSFGSLHNPGVSTGEDINWTVRTGDYWVVAGLHGSGKTDLMMLTAGIMAPAAGRYLLFGNEMPIFDTARVKQRLRLGLVFDGGQLFNQLTVRENVTLPLRYHRSRSDADLKVEVGKLLEAMELAPYADRMPGAMGRNWQKRVGLARALALRPEVLLVDNPLAGLDPRHTGWWLNFLSELHNGHPLLDSRPLTLVVTAADLRPWQGRARLFAVLRDKRLTTAGNWQQLEAENRHLLHDLLASAS